MDRINRTFERIYIEKEKTKRKYKSQLNDCNNKRELSVVQ